MQTPAITFDDVLLIPGYNHYESRRDVDIGMTDKTGKFTLGLPIITANMDTITEFEMVNFISSKGGAGAMHRFMTVEQNLNQFKLCKNPDSLFISVGTSDKEMERVEALKGVGATNFLVDVAHGHAKYVGKMLKRMREHLGDTACIMAGNVATLAGADYLASCGADIIKVGIGPGAVCTTRIKTGFGVPQLSAIQACSKVDRSIVADGGLKSSGDIVKALAFGADFVMIGSMLAATRPTPGEIITEGNERIFTLGQPLDPRLLDETPLPGSKQYKVYRGMASKEVADDYHGGLSEWKTAEGVSTKIPFRDDQNEIIADIVGGLRSGLTYSGSATIKEMQRKLNYVTVTQAGRIESLPHRTL